MANIGAKQEHGFTGNASRFKKWAAAVLPAFSLLVILLVFWWLKLVGITMAGDAFCGKAEHTHTSDCTVASLVCTAEHEHTAPCYKTTYNCSLEEHTHVVSCYSDITADLETEEDWETTLPELFNDTAAENLTTVAKSQLGYRESQLNFMVDSDEVKHGYTRYGAWYGNPYGEWSTMFTSFCLRYAGLEDVPIGSGANAVRLQWENHQFYQPSSVYTPIAGDIVFFDKDGSGSADATGIAIEVTGAELTVVEGDLNNSVAQTVYALDDAQIMGYGLTEPGNNLMLLSEGNTVIAKTTDYDQSMFTETHSFVVYTASDSDYYAFDGYGKAVPITIDRSGNISADVEDPDLLLWSFTPSGGTDSYVIQNASSGRYMHAYPNNGGGVTTAGAYASLLLPAGDGVRIKSNTEYAALNVASGEFRMTGTESQAAVYSFGIVSRCTVWLDGTNGNLMGYDGSPNKGYTVQEGDVIKLPDEWQSPAKYDYKLRGWYDVKASRYYPVGAEVTVTGNMVFYADWVAASYDIGQFNSHVTDTVSTDDFITTRIFDYGPLFNMLSESASVTVNSSGHSETWNLIESGAVPYKGNETLDFIFRDYDTWGTDISYPQGTNDRNTNGGVYSGLYSKNLAQILFDTENSYDPATGTGIIGKQYLGTADHLFQVMTDPDSADYGYYYYDAGLNAAAYNQSNRRFYVYDYLERTTDSAKSDDLNQYSDFLPFNSPYANTNGKTVRTYSYEGAGGEYTDVDHYMYDAKYNTEDNATDNVGTNYLFGMSIDINFYLPDTPGSVDLEGNYGNQDLYGKDMCFKFSGDDDVWVLLDGELVLDIGGIHGVESGNINFSTGVVTVNGTPTAMLDGVAEGDHLLTVYYLERGSSQSNCAVYFNLSPRFGFNIQKEDVLTRELLNGAEFSIYTDAKCTVPAELWSSKESFQNKDTSTHVYTASDGVATMWGLVAGKTYYIKETKPPDDPKYSCANGIIRLSLNKKGVASYSTDVLGETSENGALIEPSGGFTVYGFRIDEETQQAYIVITNAKDPITETTSVQVFKEWKDTKAHTADSVTVYLTVTDADGMVRRIREEVLSEKNDWTFTWANLPKYDTDGTTEIRYGAEEAYVPGYYPSVEEMDRIEITQTVWTETTAFQNGDVYILGTDNRYLSTTSSSETTLTLVDEETAKTSSLALWTATVSGRQVKLTNGEGQILSFNYASSSNRYFYATATTSNYQNMVPVVSGTGVKIYCTRSNRNYYLGSLNSNGTFSATTNSGSALILIPKLRTTQTTEKEVEDIAYKITNTPLETETSLKVTKQWDVGMGSAELYQPAQVTVKLLADGKDTGQRVTLSLKNGWTDTFFGLPYTDDNGDVIQYTVEESWDTEDWLPAYSDVITIDGDPNTYEITITNTYRKGYGYLLPETGGFGRSIWLPVGMTTVLFALIGSFVVRHKTKRSKYKSRH